VEAAVAPDDTRTLRDVGLLVLRVSVGFELFAHGLQKFGLFGGMTDLEGHHVSGIAAINAQADTLLQFLGYHPTVALSWFLTLTEIGAGLMLMIGLVTPLAAAAVIGDMFNLIFGLGWQNGWFGNGPSQGYEFDVIIFAAATAIILIGPGRFSVDRALGWRLTGLRWAIGAIALGIGVGMFVLTVLGPGFGGVDLSG
jgi:putative oxidoreductase